MNNIQIIPAVTDEQIHQIADLARTIWHQHFTPIIGAGQVTYMLEKFQSVPALTRQISDGYHYYLLTYDGEDAGYSGIQIQADTLFLSKLYVKQEFRGRKISSAVMRFYRDFCREKNLDKIWLTCNKDNTDTLAAYAAMGFTITDTQVTDIGSGYVMDDYILEQKYLNHQKASDDLNRQKLFLFTLCGTFFEQFLQRTPAAAVASDNLCILSLCFSYSAMKHLMRKRAGK